MNTQSTMWMLFAGFAIVACENQRASSAAPQAVAQPQAATPVSETTSAQLGQKAGTSGKSEVERGAYLVNAGACNDCHTPLKMGPNGPMPDMSLALSGHPAAMQLPPPPQLPPGPWMVTVAATNTAWAGPWGVSFTANITSDPETGIGKWTKQNFIDTVRNGRHMGAGRPLLPPMPAPAYAAMSDEDLGAIFTYLQSVRPIVNKVPAPLPPAAVAKK